jgi:tRNA wybutosine-synthesizing protein 1
LVKEHNMKSVEEYAAIVEKASPTYIEAKAYMHIGFSSLRLSYENMPSHKEVYDFAECLAKLTSYRIIDESIESRVVLLIKHKRPTRFDTV